MQKGKGQILGLPYIFKQKIDKNERDIAEVNSKLPKLLWENTNPTASFEAQDVTLNSTDYDYLVAVCSQSVNSEVTISSSMAEKGERALVLTVSNSGSSQGYILDRRTRSAAVSEDGGTVTFANGSRLISGSASTTDNSLLIPLRIIGYCYQ